MVSSVFSLSSVTITSVSTRPMVLAPPCSRRCTSLLFTCDVVVAGRSMIMPPPCSVVRSRARSRAPPVTAGAGEHLLGGGRPPRAGRVRVGPPVRRPVLQDRVEDLPGQLDLVVLREQRRLAEQHVQDQPLVGLRRRLGERVAVAEVHADV